MTEEIFSVEHRPYLMNVSAGEVRLLARLIVKAEFKGHEVVRAARLLHHLGGLMEMVKAGVAADCARPIAPAPKAKPVDHDAVSDDGIEIGGPADAP